jgi:hypothetical protein
MRGEGVLFWLLQISFEAKTTIEINQFNSIGESESLVQLLDYYHSLRAK